MSYSGRSSISYTGAHNNLYTVQENGIRRGEKKYLLSKKKLSLNNMSFTVWISLGKVILTVALYFSADYGSLKVTTDYTGSLSANL